MLRCKVCLKTFCNTDSFFVHHKICHKFEQSIYCAWSSCMRSFSNIYVLKKHMLFAHNSKDNGETNIDYGCSINNGTLPVEQHNITFDENKSEPAVTHQSAISYYDDATNIEASIAMYIAKLYDNPSLTRKLIQCIVEYTGELMSDYSDYIKCKLSASPSAFDLQPLLLDNPMKKFTSEYRRLQFFESSQKLIASESFMIGEMFDDYRKRSESVALNFKRCEGQIVPINIVLKAFLELPNVFNDIMKYISQEINCSKTIFTSVLNGTLWQSIINRNNSKDLLLPLLVYFDDYEPCNPLGSHSGVYKIGAMYFSLGCIPPKYSSQLENIFLWGLFYSSDRKHFGNKNTFKKFVETLSDLELNGIDIIVDDVRINVKFALVFIVGDNLGVNSITGMSESFSSKYFCRMCRCTKADSKLMVESDISLLRNELNYQEDLLTNINGIKEYCIFNNLSSYHCAVNISFDIMHDIYEGICRYEMAKLLSEFITNKKYFSLSLLNSRIKYFDYKEAYDIGNRIPLINDSHIENGSIIMSCSEMSAFVAYFGFIIGDLVDKEDQFWELYLSLFEIICIITKHKISVADVTYLTYLIKTHHELYISLVGALKPKHHFLIHYPDCIKLAGPLCYLSSVRFEAFHRIAKMNAHVVTSRKNIIYTLALRHQLKLSYRLLSQKGFTSKIECGPSLPTCKMETDLKMTIFLKSKKLLNDGNSFVPWIKFNNIKFETNVYVYIKPDKYGEPIIGLIKFIVLIPNQEVYFVCSKVNVVGLSSDIGGYIIESDCRADNVPLLVKYDDLFEAFPFIAHRLCGGQKAVSVLHF